MADAKTETWKICGTVVRVDAGGNAKPVYLAERAEDGAFSILSELAGEFRRRNPEMPDVTAELAIHTAERIIAGDKRALTWPLCQQVLATAVLGFAAAWNMKQAAAAAVAAPAERSPAPAPVAPPMAEPSLFGAQPADCPSCGG